MGDRIAQTRREKGVRERRDITKGEVAEATGVDPSTVSLWEGGKKSPREDTLAKLAKFLGVSPAYLRYGVAAVSPEPRPAPLTMGTGTIVAGTGAPAKKKKGNHRTA